MNVIIDGVEYEPIRKPLCTVEGKPVYKGDKLWNTPNNFKFTAKVVIENGIWGDKDNYGTRKGGMFKDISWNPPKPETVMVELLYTDAEILAHSCVTGRISLACRKALDNLKG